MTKKKLPAKPPVSLGIKPHEGERSPHVLNLREKARLDSETALSQSAPSRAATLEERVAAFDERVKDVPDLLRSHAEHFAKIFEDQKTTWQDSFSSFLEKSNSYGRTLQEKLEATAQFTKKRILHRHSRENPKNPLAVTLSKISFSFPLWMRQREFGLFLCLLIALTIPLQGLLVYRAIQTTQRSVSTNMGALRLHGNAFIQALQSQDIAAAQAELAISLAHIKNLRETIDHLGILRAVLPERMQSGYATLQLAEIAGLSSEHILAKVIDWQKGSDTLGSLIDNSHTEVSLIKRKMQALLKNPEWNTALAPMYDKATYLEDSLGVLSYFSGTKEEKHILVVFQNPRELRATGGFLGSLALLSIKDGAVQVIEVPQGGSYGSQGQLTLRRISPEPLHLINTRFELQDANWWPDFPTSAKKISELYEAAGGTTLDGVIAVTAHVGEQILAKTGPLHASGRTLTQDSFIDTLQDTIANDRATNRSTPKKIISTLFPAFAAATQHLATQEPKIALGLLTNALAHKDIQVWSRDEDAQAALDRLGFAGTMTKTSGDYLSVITSNVGGGKTDGAVEQTLQHHATLTGGGVRTTLTITRQHHGVRGNVRTGHDNISYVRIYVPRNARLISAEGFTAPPAHKFESPDTSLEPDPDVRAQQFQMQTDPSTNTTIWQEAGKTVFGQWLMVKPGESAIGEITYEVPLTPHEGTLTYTLTFDPQAGTQAQLKSEVSVDPSLALIVGEGAGIWQPSGWHFDGTLEKTVFASGIFYKI